MMKMRKNAKNCRTKDYYLVTTEHLKKGLWFRDDDDFKVGMNHAAISSFVCGILVLAFVLMSNHVHFVVYGTLEEVQRFIDDFKQQCSRILARKYGCRELLRKNSVDIQRISPDDESFERAVAYTLMNPPAANICLHPTGYCWGTGGIFFNSRPIKGNRLGSMSKREIARLMHTKRTVPDEWIISEDGYILPESYVPVHLVESIFKTPKRMDFFFRNSSKAKLKGEFKGNDLPSFRDQVLYAAIPDLCQSLFGRSRVAELDEDQKTDLVCQLRRRFSADVRQIARVTSLELDDVARKLDAP